MVICWRSSQHETINKSAQERGDKGCKPMSCRSELQNRRLEIGGRQNIGKKSEKEGRMGWSSTSVGLGTFHLFSKKLVE